MELKNGFSDKLLDIGIIATAILREGKQSKYFRAMLRSPDWLEDHAVGELEPGGLLALLNRFGEASGYAEILRQFVECAASTTISDEVFGALMQFPLRQRETWIVSLAHKQLSAKQLWILCQTNVTFECYFTLAIMQYSCSGFDSSALERTLTAFSKSPFGLQLPELLSELTAYSPSSQEKRIVLNQFEEKH